MANFLKKMQAYPKIIMLTFIIKLKLHKNISNAQVVADLNLLNIIVDINNYFKKEQYIH